MATRQMSNAPSARATETVGNAAIGTGVRVKLLKDLEETLQNKEKVREIAAQKHAATSGALAEASARNRAAAAELAAAEEEFEACQREATRKIRAAVTAEEARRLEALRLQIIRAQNAVQQGNLSGSPKLIERANKRMEALRAAQIRGQHLHLEPGSIISACEEMADALQLPDVGPATEPPVRYAPAD